MRTALQRNPLLRPGPEVAVWARHQRVGDADMYEVFIFDRTDVETDVAGSLLAHLLAVEEAGRWVVGGAAAVHGYGPLLYDFTAYQLGALHASDDQSQAARNFWARQGSSVLRSLGMTLFQRKYGVLPEILLSRAPIPDPLAMKTMQDEAKPIWIYASAGEAAGDPQVLLRELLIREGLKPAAKNPGPAARTRLRRRVYDPRAEQLRAQSQAIYESCVRKALGVSATTPFRDARGRRLDLQLPPSVRAKLIRRCAFRMGTGVQQRDQRLHPGSRTPTGKTAQESARRYQDIDTLLRNRQDYEETLALGRQSDFFRVTIEPTARGLGFFIWPIPPNHEVPVEVESLSLALRVARELSTRIDPRVSGDWWTLPKKRYSFRDVQFWLPPADLFLESA